GEGRWKTSTGVAQWCWLRGGPGGEWGGGKKAPAPPAVNSTNGRCNALAPAAVSNASKGRTGRFGVPSETDPPHWFCREIGREWDFSRCHICTPDLPSAEARVGVSKIGRTASLSPCGEMVSVSTTAAAERSRIARRVCIEPT